MRVATFNVLHGRSPADGRVEVSRLADAVRTIDADVLALQEVDHDQVRSQRADLTAVAVEAMGAAAHRFAAALGDDRPGFPGYGVALLSRFPVRSWEVVRLPAFRLPVPLRFRGRHPVLVRDEPRVAIVAEIVAPEGALTVATTHLSFLPGWSSVQLHRLVARVSGRSPLVLLGDLNMSATAARRTTGMRPLAAGLTFPAHAPRKQIDHVLGRGVAAASAGRTHALPLSDHRALSVEVTLPGAPDQPNGR